MAWTLCSSPRHVKTVSFQPGTKAEYEFHIAKIAKDKHHDLEVMVAVRGDTSWPMSCKLIIDGKNVGEASIFRKCGMVSD